MDDLLVLRAVCPHGETAAMAPPDVMEMSREAPVRPRRSRRGWLAAGAVAPALVALVVLFGGFLGFVSQLPAIASSEAGIAGDGIVVLTGGADRVSEGVRLLEAGRGRRLLISGVHTAATRSSIAETFRVSRALLDCCIDLDHRATNTIGNAIEIRRWAIAHDYNNIVIVTAAYHMPRVLNELRAVAPNLIVTPHPVFPPHFEPQDWWHDWETFRLLMVEYLKYVTSVLRVRMGIQPAFGAYSRQAI